MTFARFALALGMMPYGISKLFDMQFQVGASIYAQPLGSAPGTILTWAFLGYSPVFQFLLGVSETVPAILLLFARTRRLGALLLFPVLLNVVLFNYFLDLWPGTQFISSLLLALNLFLLLYDFRMYADFLSRLLAQPEPIASRGRRIAVKVAAFAIPVAYLGWFLPYFHSLVATQFDPITDFIGRRQINRAGSWKIDSLRIEGTPILSVAGASLYFDFGHTCVFDDGVHKELGTFEADSKIHSFKIHGITWAGSEAELQGSYRVDGPRLLLDGRSGGAAVSLILQRDRWGTVRQAKLSK
jgi:uncharacterized membrane protein YphA (DoxX/SURF4 family)